MFASSHKENGAQANDDDVTEPVAVVRLIIQWVMNFAFILTGKWFEHFRAGAPSCARLCVVRRNVTEKCYGAFVRNEQNWQKCIHNLMGAATNEDTLQRSHDCHENDKRWNGDNALRLSL